LFPDLIEIGLDVFNPFQPEVMDIFAIKKHYQANYPSMVELESKASFPLGRLMK
jgi:uroporphyrinogen decarboxylase